MDWWKKKEEPAIHKWRDIGALLLADLIQCCNGKSNPIKFFSASQLGFHLEAIDNFKKFDYAYKYDWYSCKNKNHHMVLLKTVSIFCDYKQEEICRDIVISSMVSGHKNFLRLVGCCLESEYHLVVVYDGVKKQNTLDLSEQPWISRMKIAEDIATALAYLHNAFPRPFVYRNMSLGKILIDEDGVAKLSDFSNCVSIPQGETSVMVDRLEGAYGYRDYNYAVNRVVSEKTDVFAFGIVMQNLLTGEERFPEEAPRNWLSEPMPKRKVGRTLPNMLSKSMEERRVEEIADPKMLKEIGEISEEELCRMKAFLVLSERCIGLKGEIPTMVEVAKELRKIQRSHKNASSSHSSGVTQSISRLQRTSFSLPSYPRSNPFLLQSASQARPETQRHFIKCFSWLF